MDDEKLDTLLTAWAREPVASGDAGAAAEAALAAPVQTPRRWWPAAATGGALAASLAIGLIVAGPRESVAPARQAAVAQAAAPTATDEENYAYQMMFTETPDEEMTI